MGYTVRTEVTKLTPFGRRVIDIEVWKDGTLLGGIEAKYGNSIYRASQMAKDYWLKMQGYIVNVVRSPPQ
jgi:hypothetical protein